MSYHIDTGLIKDKFKENCDCPLCEIKKIVEEGLLYEFLNDAVMEDDTRISVGEKGFCKEHFDMLFFRQNKLSVALQIGTRAEKLTKILSATPKSVGNAKKLADKIEDSVSTCVICDIVEKTMKKYYKTIAELFVRESSFIKLTLGCNGFCFHHYAELLRYSSYAGFGAKEYINALSTVQNKSFEKMRAELKAFCDKHDYRNSNAPLGSAETALPRMREKLFGKKYE